MKVPVKCIRDYKDFDNAVIFKAGDVYNAIFDTDDVLIYDSEDVSWCFAMAHYLPNYPNARRASEYFNIEQYKKFKSFI